MNEYKNYHNIAEEYQYKIIFDRKYYFEKDKLKLAYLDKDYGGYIDSSISAPALTVAPKVDDSKLETPHRRYID
jgi:hypothetical protein